MEELRRCEVGEAGHNEGQGVISAAGTKVKREQLVGDTPGEAGWINIVYGLEWQAGAFGAISADTPALDRLT